MIATLGLAAGFTAPAGSRAQFARIEQPARGVLIAQNEHPEWKQFLVRAAVRRTQQLELLLDLPDQRPAGARSRDDFLSAGLPASRSDAEPEEITGSTIDKSINEVITIDIGETSATELPVGPPQTTPAVEKPQRLKLPNESSAKPAAKPRRAKAYRRKPVKPAEAAATTDLWTVLFGTAETPPAQKAPAKPLKRRTAATR